MAAIIHPLLDKEKQERARLYEKENRLLGLAGLLLSLLILLAFYYSGASGRLAQLFPGQPIVLPMVVYAAVFLSALTLLTLPLSFYSSYLHEHKWRFSNQTVKAWLWERAKSFLVSLLLGCLLLGLFFWILALSPRFWWLISGLTLALLSTLFATLFPVVILPLFNKYTRIEDEVLAGALEKILRRGGLRSSGFFKEDMSRQTKKENAFLAGLGKTRRVVLADNLMEHRTVPEIVSIMAHEVGHYRHKHIWKNILIGTAQQIVVFFFLDLILRGIFPGFLSSTRWNLEHFPLFIIFLGALSGLLFGPLSLALSRRYEKQADEYALQNIDDKQAFLIALAGLADRNLSNAYPAWWVKLLYYSHPPIGERLAEAEKFIPQTPRA
jgi:STE24 endopeptidase